MSRRVTYSGLACLVLALACNDPVSSRPTGSYQAEVSGDLTRSLRGEARLAAGQSGYGRAMLSLVLGADGGKDRIVLMIAGSRPPRVGSYTIAPYSSEPLDGQWVAVYATEAGEAGGHFTSIGGTLRVTHVAHNRLQGTFSVDAEGALGGSVDGPKQIVIEGSFDAQEETP